MVQSRAIRCIENAMQDRVSSMRSAHGRAARNAIENFVLQCNISGIEADRIGIERDSTRSTATALCVWLFTPGNDCISPPQEDRTRASGGLRTGNGARTGSFAPAQLLIRRRHRLRVDDDDKTDSQTQNIHQSAGADFSGCSGLDSLYPFCLTHAAGRIGPQSGYSVLKPAC